VIVGAAIVPTTPLLVPGATVRLPSGLARVGDAACAALCALPQADAVVLLAADAGGTDSPAEAGGTDSPAEAGGTDSPAGVSVAASLAGFGRADLCATVPVAGAVARRVAGAGGRSTLVGAGFLPPGLAALVLLVGAGVPVVPVTVPRCASAGALAATGAAIATAVRDGGERVAVIAAGDLSAGLTDRSPLARVEGAVFWDEQAAAAVDSGRFDGFARLGPAGAGRVGAVGWAPMMVLSGICAEAAIGMVVRHYSAPRGVGYLVAQGA